MHNVRSKSAIMHVWVSGCVCLFVCVCMWVGVGGESAKLASRSQ